ncbi:MAG: hypothetical protein U0939_14800 [Pirellulales bacterium]
MSQSDTAHAWWSRLRHQGLLLSPVVMVERYADAPPSVPFYVKDRLRNAHTRLLSSAEKNQKKEEFDQAAILSFVDSLLENFVGHPASQIAKQHSIPDKLTVAIRIGTRSETIKPHRILFADESGETPALMVMVDTSPHVGRGRGRTTYARFLELLRGTGHRLGLLTNGQQFRLIYAGLDFESWCEWESERWFDDGEGTEELLGLRQLLCAESLKPVKEGVSGLLDGVEESRKRQADLSSVLRENVRQAVELLLEDVSTANRVHPDLFNALVTHGDRTLTDAEAHEALMQATVRIVMRLVVCLFAESRQLLPTNDPIYGQSYGVRSLYQLLDQAARYEGGTHVLFNKQTAWPRLMALFRLIHNGSSHGAFPLRPYGGVLFRPGDESSSDPVSRALHILEHSVSVGDATVFYVLKKLLRGPLPVIKGKSKTYVEGPVDYTDLRTEFIGLIYEGLLDYRLKRTDEQIGPQIFLNIGREPVLPLSRLTDMLQTDKKGLKDLLATLGKEKAAPTTAEDTEESDEGAEDQEESSDEESTTEETVEVASTDELQRGGDYLDAVEAANSWAKEAVVLAGIVPKQKKNQNDAEYQTVIEAEANRLIKRVVSTGEFYLVRAGNTRKGTGTFYTRPQLAVPTVHRTLQPLCYDKAGDGTLTPKTPEEILGLKVCDPACGSASFLVAALHYLTDALYKSLCHHKKLDDPATSKKITLPFGRPRTNTEADQLVPFPPDDPQRGDTFEDRIKALLRRHVVERCIYGVDVNALAVELARVSLWVETLDPELPFSFLDHKIKVGNSLVGCWLDRVEDYPLKAWEREGGDGPKGERSQRIEEFLKGPKVGNRRTGDGRIKEEMRQVIESKFSNQAPLFPDMKVTTESVVTEARAEYEKLHDLPVGDPDERERYYRDHIQNSPTLRTLKAAMDEWCAIWFWPTDEESLKHVPTPLTFHEPKPEKDAIVERLASEVKFFHWELEFPDVFSSERCGFDGVLGNPPWENAQPNPQEFFTEFDPLFRTYGRIQSLQQIESLFAAIPDLEDRWLSYCGQFKSFSTWVAYVAEPFGSAGTSCLGRSYSTLQHAWDRVRSERIGFATAQHPFVRQQGRIFTYRLFLESSFALLRDGGVMGIIVPSGIYSDSWTHPLRSQYITQESWMWLFGFINWDRIFNIYYRFKFAILIVRHSRNSLNSPLRAAFSRYRISDWEQAERVCFDVSASTIQRFSPDNLALPEISNQRDLEVMQVVYDNSWRVGDAESVGQFHMSTEFMMNTDAKHFPPIEKWREKGFTPDAFGRWTDPDGEVALPLYEGRMIGQFDFANKAYERGRGRSATWTERPFDAKQIEPQYLLSASTYNSWPKAVRGERIAFMEIASATNSRSFVGTLLPSLPCNHKVPLLTVDGRDEGFVWLTAGVMNSLVFDFVLRTRLGGLSISWAMLSECPIPRHFRPEEETHVKRSACQLSFVHRRFAPQWLKAQKMSLVEGSTEWKHLWAVAVSDRIRLRLQVDALCAKAYGLDPESFDWIVREDVSDPKGFWRVDKGLANTRERYPALASTAFRALMDGRWCAESAPNLSNDEFFDIIGVPEMTNAEAAKAKGESGPLILKRDGCHVWKPENFPADDPRHGWTWDDCWNDAVALLGSEDAVREYIDGKPDEPEEEPEHTGPRDLFGDPIIEKAKQKKLF